MANVSVVIINYNTKELLRNLLQNLQKLKNVFEIIVVDNASTDGSYEMVKKFFPSVKIIRNRENYGFAKACNIGIKKSSGNFILILNTDIELVDKDFLNKMLKVAKLKKSWYSWCAELK